MYVMILMEGVSDPKTISASKMEIDTLQDVFLCASIQILQNADSKSPIPSSEGANLHSGGCQFTLWRVPIYMAEVVLGVLSGKGAPKTGLLWVPAHDASPYFFVVAQSPTPNPRYQEKKLFETISVTAWTVDWLAMVNLVNLSELMVVVGGHPRSNICQPN